MRAVGRGNLCKLHRPATDHDPGGWRYGREIPLAVVHERERGAPRQGHARHALEALGRRLARTQLTRPADGSGRAVFEERVLPLVPALVGGGTLWQLVERTGILIAQVDYLFRRRSPPGAIPRAAPCHAPTERARTIPHVASIARSCPFVSQATAT